MSEEKLLDCPFCGRKAMLFEQGYGCSKCPTLMHRAANESLEIVKHRWNTRQSSEPKGDYQEGIEEGIKIGEARQSSEGVSEEVFVKIEKIASVHDDLVQKFWDKNARVGLNYKFHCCIDNLKALLSSPTNNINQITSEKDL